MYSVKSAGSLRGKLRRLGTADVADATARFLAGVRRGGRPTIGRRFGAPSPAAAGRPTFLYPCYPCNPWPATGASTEAGELFLLFLAESLERGIGAQRVPDWIEPKKGRRNGRFAVNPAFIGRF